MQETKKYLENADNCIELAEQARDGPAKARYHRMARAWFALAKEQEWLDGEVSPLSNATGGETREPPV